MSDKIIKTIQLKWSWNGDIYLLRGFNIALMPVDRNPKDNPDSVIVSAFVPITDASTNEFKHSFTNITLDRFSTYTPWVQTVFENDDSQWISFSNQVADDDGSATIVTTTNPTLQQVVDMANDDKVTPQEKANLKLEWDEISDEHLKILSDCSSANMSLKDVDIYKSQAQSLANYLNAGTTFTYIKPGAPGYVYPELIKSAGTTTLSTDGYASSTVFRNKFLDYYSAKKLILDKIRDKIIQDSQGDIGDIPGLDDILPNNPVSGGYYTGDFAINKNNAGVADPGEIQVISGKFIHPNGKKYLIPSNTFIPTSLEGKEGRFRYILFIGSDKTRFEAPTGATSSDFVAATYKNKQWSYYIDNDIPKTFEVNDNDCILAKIKEFERSDEGTGIKSIMVYSDSRDSVFDALTNGGEVQGLYMKDGLVMLNAEFVKTGKLASVNNVSEFDLDKGTFRLGGTGISDYKMYFDGTDLHMGEGAIKWANLDDQSKTNLKGEPGTDGKDATTYYSWIRYADNASGGGMSASPDGKLYIGMAYNKTTATPSSTASDYAWSLIKGTDGKPGLDGSDGKTYYMWIKYADSPTSGMSDSPDGKKYIGVAHNKATSSESTNYGDYTWSLIKGSDGSNGITYYTWIRYADNASGGGISSSPTNKLYVGIAYNKTSNTPSNTPTDYAWSLIKGTDGKPGLDGSDGKTYYVWIKYADSPTSGMSDSSTGKLYMGIAYNKTTPTESTSYSDYSWSLIKGTDGGKGDKGDTGNSASIIYRRELIKPSTPTGNSPSGWTTSSENAPGTGVLWVSQGIKTPTGTLVGSWTEPVQLEVSTTNLLHNHKWTIGTGTCGIYRQSGSDSENIREVGDTPFGRGVIWKAISKDANDTNEGPDGGWNADIQIDHTRGYMSSVWAYQTHSGGSVYLGCRTGGDTLALNGTADGNPCFWSGDLPVMNKWYLLVGFINGSGDSTTTGNGKGGVYDPATGERVIPFNTFKNKSGATYQTHRAYYYYDSDATGTHYTSFYGPRFDIIDGTEPTISDLLGMSPQLDWVKEWNGTKTEIGGQYVIAPKIFAGTKESDGTATGVAMGANIFGSGSSYSGIAGYKAGLKTFHLKTDGSAVFGTRAGNQLILNTDGSIDTPNINANKVTAGILRSTNGKSYINLDNADMSLGSKSDANYLSYVGGKLDIKMGGNTVATSGDITSITQTIETNERQTSFKFKSIGLQNMLPNSDFLNLINKKPFGHDYTYLRWDDKAGGTTTLGCWSKSSEWVPLGREYAIVVEGVAFNLVNGVANSVAICAGFDCPKFITTPGTTYRFSMKAASHRLKGISIECLCYNRNGQRLPGNNAITVEGLKSGGKEFSNWTHIQHSFVAPPDAQYCCVRIYMNEPAIDTNGGDPNNCYLFIVDPMVNEGEVWLDWTAKSADVYLGGTDITTEGVKVSMANGDGPQGYSLVSSQGLEIFDSSEERVAWFGDSKTAFIDTLKANHIENRHVLRWNEHRPSNFYVATTQTGDGTGRDVNNKANSVNGVLNWIWNTYGCYSWKKDLVINIDQGDYYEDVYVGGWQGTGILKLLFHPYASLYGTITVEECEMYVDLKGGRQGWDTNNGCVIYPQDTAITVRNSVCYVDGFRSRPSHYPNYGGTFVRAKCGAKVLISSCDVVKYWHFAFGEILGHIHLADNRGDVQQIAGDSFNSSYYLLGTNRPLCNSGGEFINCWNTYIVHQGGTRVNSVWIPKDTTPPPPPTPTYQWFEQSFSLGGLRTVPEGSGSGTTGRSGEWGQGKWGSYKAHRGYADMWDGPANWCSGGRNFTVWLNLTRLSTSHGYGGAVPVPKIKRPDGRFWNSGVAFARGDTKSIQLPSDIGDAIANGRMKTLEMWADSSANDYSFYNNSSIRIKCEKRV